MAKAIVVKAVAWLASRQAKLAEKAANEKRERIIADVWEEMRRNRDMPRPGGGRATEGE